jgi:colicin import membrane protein
VAAAASSGSCARAGRRITLPGTYVVARGDTLWQIAETYYSNGERYRAIARVNRENISDPDLIFPCQKVYLPARRPR